MNMYYNKLVASIKSNGAVLRDIDNTVKLKFGSEFSIYLKNLNTLRASIKIEIDGKDVLDGTSLILDAKEELNLERFIKNGNLEKGNRFKFIERNSKVEAARGIGAEDGLVRIEFQFERDYVKEYNETIKTKTIEHHHHHYDKWPTQVYWNCVDPSYYGSGNIYTTTANDYSCSLNANTDGYAPVAAAAGPSASSAGGGGILRSRSMAKSAVNTMTSNASAASAPINNAGITAPGSVSTQTFTTVAPLSLQTETHVIVLKLLGETETGKKIEKPVTVKSKNKCSVCNRVNKATAKFCGDCGAGLEIVK